MAIPHIEQIDRACIEVLLNVNGFGLSAHVITAEVLTLAEAGLCKLRYSAERHGQYLTNAKVMLAYNPEGGRLTPVQQIVANGLFGSLDAGIPVELARYLHSQIGFQMRLYATQQLLAWKCITKKRWSKKYKLTYVGRHLAKKFVDDKKVQAKAEMPRQLLSDIVWYDRDRIGNWMALGDTQPPQWLDGVDWGKDLLAKEIGKLVQTIWWSFAHFEDWGGTTD